MVSQKSVWRKRGLPESMEGGSDHDSLRQVCTAQRFSSMIIVRLLSPRAFLVGLHHRSLLGHRSRRCYGIKVIAGRSALADFALQILVSMSELR